jgi:hypothetical protein
MNYVAFDIETARLAPDDEKGIQQRPLGISCYALAWREPDGVKSEVGFGKDGAGKLQPQMSRAECQALVQQLGDLVAQGFALLTWNGLGFDFDILAEESGMHAACCELARNHVDMMFAFFCLRGYPLGLDTAAKGMGIQGKPAGMDGSQAPLLWSQGKFEMVLNYVTQDVSTTLELVAAVEKRGQLCWTTRAGKSTLVPIPKWMKVTEALALPLPDVSWMRTPMKRDHFTRWMEMPE